MTVRRVVAATALVALSLSGCSNDLIGRHFPDCDIDQLVSGEIVLQAQAVPTATVGPCIRDLPPGWNYEHQQARSGLARFWLSSDLMGHRFVEVSLRPSCELGGAIRRPSPLPEVDAYLTGSPYVEPVGVTLIPTTADVVWYAAALGVALSAEDAQGRPFDLRLAATEDPIEAAEDAAGAGRIVLTADEHNAEENTVDLLIPGLERRGDLTLDQAIEEIEEHVTEPTYRADWFFVFQGGCIVWDFDAEGEMVASVDEDMQQAVGFYDLGTLRRQMAAAGFPTGP